MCYTSSQERINVITNTSHMPATDQMLISHFILKFYYPQFFYSNPLICLKFHSLLIFLNILLKGMNRFKLRIRVLKERVSVFADTFVGHWISSQIG